MIPYWQASSLASLYTLEYIYPGFPQQLFLSFSPKFLFHDPQHIYSTRRANIQRHILDIHLTLRFLNIQQSLKMKLTTFLSVLFYLALSLSIAQAAPIFGLWGSEPILDVYDNKVESATFTLAGIATFPAFFLYIHLLTKIQ